MQQYESFGKYVLLEKLATGGMAEVFLARAAGVGGIAKFFAIKRILPQYADSPEFIEMFREEAKIAINLNHSNIVSIHEFGVQNHQFFLVMDYVEGRNMRQILNKMKKNNLQFSIDQVIYMVKEVAAGLDHAHRCLDGSTGKPLNITHRDMSPQNVMVSFEGEVKIVDFGIAKAESQIETTRAGTLKGKFGYMSPEQAEGHPVDIRTDIFSLGIVLWELLANERLFSANNEINTLRKIRDCQIPPLRKLNPNIQPELERIAQKALARDRNLRYQTAAAFHRDLNRFLNRQYPDFSSHDFSVFVKSVFADEILSLRKRLVEYSKSTLTPTSVPMPMEEKTAIVPTQTNSMVSEDTPLNATNSQAYFQKEESSIPSKISVSQLSYDTSPNVIREPEQTATGPAAETGTQKPLLDDMALATQVQHENTFHQPGQTQDDTASPAPDVALNEPRTNPSFTAAPTHVRVFTQNRPAPTRMKKKKTSSFVTLLLFLFLCSGIYSYLVKNYTAAMAPVIKETDPILGSYHRMLGIDEKALENASKATPSHIHHPAPAVPLQAPTPQTVAQAADAHTAPEASPKPETSDYMIVSSRPSGAQIFIDDKPTGMLTPSRLKVPSDRPFKIVLKKRGYKNFEKDSLSEVESGNHLTADLEEMAIGYLDINIIPPRDVKIKINGQITDVGRLPVHGLVIPANTQIRVEAVNEQQGFYGQATTKVGENGRGLVTITLRKTGRRIPSSEVPPPAEPTPTAPSATSPN